MENKQNISEFIRETDILTTRQYGKTNLYIIADYIK